MTDDSLNSTGFDGMMQLLDQIQEANETRLKYSLLLNEAEAHAMFSTVLKSQLKSSEVETEKIQAEEKKSQTKEFSFSENETIITKQYTNHILALNNVIAKLIRENSRLREKLSINEEKNDSTDNELTMMIR